jgi:hypothetical protein
LLFTLLYCFQGKTEEQTVLLVVVEELEDVLLAGAEFRGDEELDGLEVLALLVAQINLQEQQVDFGDFILVGVWVELFLGELHEDFEAVGGCGHCAESSVNGVRGAQEFDGQDFDIFDLSGVGKWLLFGDVVQELGVLATFAKLL